VQPPLANVFQPLINVFEAILKVFHDHVGLGWGLAIIALTVLIRSLLLPLTLKQLRSMYRMAQFTPEIKKLRDKHGSDPQRLQRETLAFYPRGPSDVRSPHTSRRPSFCRGTTTPRASNRNGGPTSEVGRTPCAPNY